MSKIEVKSKSGVIKNLTTVANSYKNNFYTNLNNANKTFEKLNGYWRGQQYIDTMSCWNKNVVIINLYSKDISISIQNLNSVLFDITKADDDPKKLPTPEVLKLQMFTIDKNNDSALVDPSVLREDLKTVKGYIDKALASCEEMLNNVKRAPWASKRIDDNASFTEKNLSHIKQNLEDLKKNLNDSISAIAQGFENADKV